MLDLISTTEELHYENYRQQQMETRKFGEPKVKRLENPKFKEEEEQLRRKFTEQVKGEEARFRHWEQQVSRVYPLINIILTICLTKAYRGARSSQQRPRDCSQRDQAARGRA